MTRPDERRPGLNKAARNERTKLTATWLNGGAIAGLAIGCFAPITAAVIGTTPIGSPALFSLVMGWLTVSLGIHAIARRVLMRIEE